MFRRTSVTRDRSESTLSVKSPPRRAHVFYQHPSGSRFTEDSVSGVLSSETGSDTTSLASGSAHSVPSVESTSGVPARTQRARLQKSRRGLQSGFRPLSVPHIDEALHDSGSEVTSRTWSVESSMVIPTSDELAPMPIREHGISFCPSPHPAESFMEDDRLQVRSDENPSLVLLRAVVPEKSQLCAELLQTSLPPDGDMMRDIMPRRNGFVDTVLEAYNNHRGLIIRPDDIWLAIMTQFSFFVNGHPEALRNVFVAHQGKPELVVESGGSRFHIDTASMVHRMAAMMESHIVDPSLRDWIMPNFTTTTPVDKTTCVIVMMGMMKDHFTYKFALRCGIPKVTLEGSKEDWQIILFRLEYLKRYGIRTIAWYHLLRPILVRFVTAYDDPSHPDNLAFWNKIAHHEGGSGPQWLSGWITAFCVFNERGQWQGNTLVEDRIREREPKKLLRPADPLHLTPTHFAAVYMVRARAPYLALDGFPYPTIKIQDIPCGVVCLDVTLEDNGVVMESILVAGSVGAQICSTEKTELFRNGLRDTVRPVSAWWYLTKRRGVKVETEGESETNSMS